MPWRGVPRPPQGNPKILISADAAGVFELVEAPFDQIAQGIQRVIHADAHFAGLAHRNLGKHIPRIHLFRNAIIIIASVCQQDTWIRQVVGLDLAKSVFQAHGVNETGDAVLVKKLHRKRMIRRMAELTDEICALDNELKAWCGSNEASQRRYKPDGSPRLTSAPG